jgi:hypothetical protein
MIPGQLQRLKFYINKTPSNLDLDSMFPNSDKNSVWGGDTEGGFPVYK